MTRPEAENALSDDAEVGGVANQDLATPERIESSAACCFHHAKVSVFPAFLDLIVFCYFSISSLIGEFSCI